MARTAAATAARTTRATRIMGPPPVPPTIPPARLTHPREGGKGEEIRGLPGFRTSNPPMPSVLHTDATAFLPVHCILPPGCLVGTINGLYSSGTRRGPSAPPSSDAGARQKGARPGGGARLPWLELHGAAGVRRFRNRVSLGSR